MQVRKLSLPPACPAASGASLEPQTRLPRLNESDPPTNVWQGRAGIAEIVNLSIAVERTAMESHSVLALYARTGKARRGLITFIET
jgi:hypothetical protein